MKLWAKTVKNERLLQNLVMTNELPLNRDNFESFLMKICESLDIPTPVTLPTHYDYLNSFNIVKYFPRDFVEFVDFELFTVENVE